MKWYSENDEDLNVDNDGQSLDDKLVVRINSMEIKTFLMTLSVKTV